MKIVQVAPRYPPRTGGVETHVKEVSERLVDRGHEVTVLTADAGRAVRSTETRNGVAVRRHRALAPGGAYHVAPGLLGTVRRVEADLVHAHNYHSLPLLFARLGRRKAPFVATPHYHAGSASAARNALLGLYRPLGGWVLADSDAVIAVSEWERDRIAATFGIEATVVPNGVDRDRFAAATPERRDRPYILTVGRIEAYKGIQHLIDALPRVEDYALLVAGDGPYLGELRDRVADRGLEDRVVFPGFVDGDRLPELYAGAAVFVSLSSFEAYGITVAEALAAGTPCVVRETGALADWSTRPDVVGISETRPAPVAAAVDRASSLTVTGSVPSWETVVDRLEAIYDRHRRETR